MEHNAARDMIKKLAKTVTALDKAVTAIDDCQWDLSNMSEELEEEFPRLTQVLKKKPPLQQKDGKLSTHGRYLSKKEPKRNQTMVLDG